MNVACYRGINGICLDKKHSGGEWASTKGLARRYK